MNFKFDERMPIYLQIVDEVKRDIIKNELKRGDKMPSVRDLSEAMKVNPNTVQRAYQELEREEITYSKRGMGTFISEDEGKIQNIKNEMANIILMQFVDGMKSLGFCKNEIIEVAKKYIEEGE